MLSQFAFVLLFSGFAFKMSVVPFHLWTADVYEGSPVAVTAFLSVVSKSAIAFVFIQVLHKVFHNLEATYVLSLAVVSVVTVLIGNLFAMRQENIKRFLAFSSIAQVGYILFALIGSAALSQSAVIYFMLVYLVSNLAAFGVVGVISDYTGKENISDYKGFYQENKFLSWTLAIALFSLAGVPPTAGFFGKFFLLLAAASKGYYLLIAFAALNMVVSFYYYLRVVKNIFMENNETPILAISLAPITKIALIICLVGILLIGLYGPIYEYLASFTEVF
jgi:NADH-quinone oxidoreductase subunit N